MRKYVTKVFDRNPYVWLASSGSMQVEIVETPRKYTGTYIKQGFTCNLRIRSRTGKTSISVEEIHTSILGAFDSLRAWEKVINE